MRSDQKRLLVVTAVTFAAVTAFHGKLSGWQETLYQVGLVVSLVIHVVGVIYFLKKGREFNP